MLIMGSKARFGPTLSVILLVFLATSGTNAQSGKEEMSEEELLGEIQKVLEEINDSLTELLNFVQPTSTTSTSTSTLSSSSPSSTSTTTFDPSMTSMTATTPGSHSSSVPTATSTTEVPPTGSGTSTDSSSSGSSETTPVPTISISTPAPSTSTAPPSASTTTSPSTTSTLTSTSTSPSTTSTSTSPSTTSTLTSTSTGTISTLTSTSTSPSTTSTLTSTSTSPSTTSTSTSTSTSPSTSTSTSTSPSTSTSTSTSPSTSTSTSTSPSTSTSTSTSPSTTSTSTSTSTSPSTTSTSTSTSTSPSTTSTLTSTSTSPSTTSTLTSTSTSPSTTSTSTSTSTSPSTTSTSTSTSTSPATTSTSTSTSTSPTATSTSASPSSTTFYRLVARGQRATEDICTSASDEDLCDRLKTVLSDIESSTKEIAEGDVSQEHLESLKSDSFKLDEVVKDVKEDGDFEFDATQLADKIREVEDTTEQALDYTKDKLTELQSDYTLVIVISVVGSLVVLSLISIFGFVFYRRKQMKKPYNQVLGEEIPIKNFLASGHDNEGFHRDESRARPPPVAARPHARRDETDTSTPYKDSRHSSPYRQPPRPHTGEGPPASLDRPSRYPPAARARAEPSLERLPRRQNVYENPDAPRDRYARQPYVHKGYDSSSDRRAGRPHAGRGYESSLDRYDRPRHAPWNKEEDKYDPYSLDRPGVQKKTYAGQLRRYM
ncbi:serine-rich adhesin for platelets-like [Penaeus japonicus]|uniref:serine-rich adhesin for platelets-like n=1 Tax=Penaeus japonicus TaxID=27405 RepID=UPI001C713B00|nr:serine-rich adhesin for platelets-like [Penaeus japonicus]